jgi:hypothetical protein
LNAREHPTQEHRVRLDVALLIIVLHVYRCWATQMATKHGSGHSIDSRCPNMMMQSACRGYIISPGAWHQRYWQLRTANRWLARRYPNI